MRQPNILMIMADQLTALALPAYGHKVVRTPHLDRLAAEGVLFEQAYCNFPLCAPSRASLMSGRLASRIGVYDNAAEFRASVPTLAHGLRALGYRTCLAGKMHFVGPDQLHGFEERLTTDIYPADFGWTPNWDEPEERIDWWYHNMASVKEAGHRRGHQPARLRRRGRVPGRAPAGRARPRARDGRPLFLCVSFTHPHDPYAMPREPIGIATATSEIDLPARVAGAAPDAHSRRLPGAGRHGDGRDHRGRRPPRPARLLWRDRLSSTTRSGGCWRRWSGSGCGRTRSSWSPPTMARCWASAAFGTRCTSSNGRCACR